MSETITTGIVDTCATGTDMDALIEELRQRSPEYDEAQAVVALVWAAGDAIERMRLRRGWTQGELAQRLGVTAARVSQLESGTLGEAPSLKMLARVAHVCGETVRLVTSGEDAAAAERRPESPVAPRESVPAAPASAAPAPASASASPTPAGAPPPLGDLLVEMVRLRRDIAGLQSAVDSGQVPAAPAGGFMPGRAIGSDRAGFDVAAVPLPPGSSDRRVGPPGHFAKVSAQDIAPLVADQTLRGIGDAALRMLKGTGLNVVGVVAAEPWIADGQVELRVTLGRETKPGA